MQCMPGFFQPQPGQATCQACDIGFFASEPRAMTCKEAPAVCELAWVRAMPAKEGWMRDDGSRQVETGRGTVPMCALCLTMCGCRRARMCRRKAQTRVRRVLPATPRAVAVKRIASPARPARMLA
jgi:hypothetical protein